MLQAGIFCKCLFGFSPLLTGIYYDLLYEHLYMDYLHSEYPVPDADLVAEQQQLLLRKKSPMLKRQNTPGRDQLEQLKALSIDEIQHSQEKVEEALSTS